VPDALFTAGTTAVDATGRPWAYLAFQTTDDRVLRGREFTIHRKRGLAADAGSFERQGVVGPVRDLTALAVLVERGRQLGENLVELDGILRELHRVRLGDAGQATTARLLGDLLVRGDGDTETLGLLRLLGQTHPTVKMALGEAWAGPLDVAPGLPVTFEVREVLPGAAGAAGGVVGRVTLTSGQPVMLPAPGAPLQVPDLSPKGDLNIKLRWGQGDELRRQSPLGNGFTVWRMLRSVAAARGVEATAPGLEQLQGWLRAGEATRVTEGPVFVSRILSLAEAADLRADATNYFLVDDGNRYRRNAAGLDVDEPIVEGTEYTYFVCARDLLGRDGPPSAPGHGVACRTLPPPIPGGLRVENVWEPNAVAGTQSFQFLWNANRNNARDVTHHYEVYRGTNLTQLQSDAAKALLVPVSGQLVHGADGETLSFVDTAPEVLTSEFGHTFWYSVRAVHLSPCGPIQSDFAAPVLIARRQREGPPAPRGLVDFGCHRASVIVAGQENVGDPALPPNDGLIRVRILCRRLDPGIASVDFSVRLDGRDTDLGRHVYAAEGEWVVADYEIHRNELAGRPLTVICQATSHTGALSNPRALVIDHLTSEGRREVTFQARTLSDGDLVPGEPFSDELLEPPVSVPVATTTEGAAIAVRLDAFNGRNAVVEVSPLVAAVSRYSRAGHGTVREGSLPFSIAPVAAGASQPLLGGRVYPIREFGGAACVDLAYNPSTGRAGKLGVTLFTTPRTAEYRLFRRINEGPYTLVADGGAAFVEGTLNVVRREDDALPATDCTICYYTQMVDRDGNASALVRLEPCIERRSPTLPKPNLAPPEAVGTAASAGMKLTWMCSPQGVDRFLITIKAKGGAAAQSALERGSAFTLTAPLAARIVQYVSAGGDVARETTTRAEGTSGQASGSDRAQWLGLPGGAVSFQKMIQTSTFMTPILGQNYPATPPFTAEFKVQPGTVYVVHVQAVRGPILGGQGRGPASGMYEFKWEDPSRPEPAVAWPARPFGPVTVDSQVQAEELKPVLWPASLDGQKPVGIRVAVLPNAKGEDFVMEGSEVVFAPAPDSPMYRRQDPNAHWLGGLGDGVNAVQGVVLYRRQVANTLFPSVPGETVQVSPLIRKIAWIPTSLKDGRNGARLIDPYFALSMIAPRPDVPGDHGALNLWLLDNQGVVDGARYHYYLVCLGTDGEIRRTLDAGFYGPR
jgi:hypothetical protein